MRSHHGVTLRDNANITASVIPLKDSRGRRSVIDMTLLSVMSAQSIKIISVIKH